MLKVIECIEEIGRTTTFFRDLLKLKVDIAYTVMEYLLPDESFPPKIDNDIKNKMLSQDFEGAYEDIIEDMYITIDSSWALEKLREETIQAMQIHLESYKNNKITEKENKRLELLKQLKELDEE